VARSVEAYGQIDVLVNNAGFNARGDYASLEPADIAMILDTNLKAPMLLTRFALPHLERTRGVVVNVASIAGHVHDRGAHRGVEHEPREQHPPQGAAERVAGGGGMLERPAVPRW
jgi:NADP-dependent 3-hydroxy acid dehydrogenase YdfG